MDKLQELWQAALGEIQLNISRANFITWFRHSTILEKKGDVVYIGVPSNFAKEWFQNKYHKQILNALQNLDNSIKKVDYIITPIKQPISPLKTKKKEVLITIANEQLNLNHITVDPITNLNKKYTFENFVVGANNELAQAAALSVTENLGTGYNPLFIYGGVGLGKTHLLVAIGNRVIQKNKKLKIRYIPSEKFSEELVTAIREQKMSEFKKSFNNLDLLLIDDIQFIAGKDKTQEELFHIFNNLYGKNKQIVFTSDRPPKVIPSVEERLRSRFEGGMIADISYPDLETRIAILKSKNQEKNVNIPEEILKYIAETIPKNIRELEGALNRVIAYAKLKNTHPTLEEVKKIITAIAERNQKFVSPKEVIKKIADFYDVTENDLTNHSRKQELVKPRQVAMYILREELQNSYDSIGEKLGRRDHTTVMYACKKIAEEIEKNPFFAQEVAILKEKLYNI